MEIKVFVVETEIQHNTYNKALLFEKKIDLIRLFGGLTEVKDIKGYWIDNETNNIETDTGKIWLIYSEKGYEKNIFDKMRKILVEIKHITKQKVQMYTIGTEPHFI